MKYEFHIGDYVETKGGAKGYVSNSNTLWWECTYEADGYSKGFHYSIDGTENNNIKKYFNRIGQYDFTKPESKSIERLPVDLVARFEIPDGRYITTKTWNDDGEFVEATYSRELIDKINELVEAVNELNNKIN